MEIFTGKNKELSDKKAFEIIKTQVLKKPDSLIGIAVGKTTDGLYKLISKDAVKSTKKWRKIKLFQIDENLGAHPSSPVSFNFEIRKELKQLLNILNSKNIFLMDGTEKPKKTIKEAYKFIKSNGGIDLIILGIGPEYDPHVAYNTTGKSALNSRMRVVDLHPKVIEKLVRAYHGKPQRKIKGITLGIKDILETKKALLIAYGKEKAKSFKLILKKKVNMKKGSVTALLLHKNLEIVVDKDVVK
ncbi:MAG: 6-phosphogluconolactonase [Candidatus Melainabacteria bacterium]|nr:6-phosphogluconolactonase [Candidatus Melainabacteria bacterium]